jgi:ribonuclease HI
MRLPPERAAARALAEAIERALLRFTAANVQRVLELARREDASRAADRVQLRAQRLAKAQAALRGPVLAAAEALVLRIYQAAAPSGWLCAWCDATVVRDGAPRRAAVGALLLDRHAREFARISEPIAACEPFEAEIAALAATLQAAAARGARARRLCVYTDCDALVALWLQQRRDARLGAVRALARRLQRFELRLVPRRHNRMAHRLARAAMAAARGTG